MSSLESDAHGGGDAAVSGDTAVPIGETPVTCPYCDRPFHGERLCTLHRGLEHYERLDDDERAAFEAAYLDEYEEIRHFRLKLVAALVALYFVMLFVYAFVT